MSLQDQIYVITGVFSGVAAVLMITVIVLITMVCSLKKKLKKYGSGGKFQNRFATATGQAEVREVQRGMEKALQSPTNGPPMALVPPPARYSQQYTQAPFANLIPQNISRHTSDVAYERDRTAGGVRVLPGGNGLNNRNSQPPVSKPTSNWSQRADKGLDKFDKAQNKFEDYQDRMEFVDQIGISQEVFGSNLGDLPGMDDVAGVGEFTKDMNDITNMRKAEIPGIGKGQGFKKPW